MLLKKLNTPLLLIILLSVMGCDSFWQEKKTKLPESNHSAKKTYVENVPQPPKEVAVKTKPTSQTWLTKLKSLASIQQQTFRIVQLGDSHTAGDFFTDTLRNKLQNKFGNAGIGWVYPSKVGGQRQAKVTYNKGDWSIISSRRETLDSFPLGGIVATNSGIEKATINSRASLSSAQKVTITARAVSGNAPLKIVDAKGSVFTISPAKASSQNSSQNLSDWQHKTITSFLPISYSAAMDTQWHVGYINIENQQPGVTVSAFGINGATLKETTKWRENWVDDLVKTQADLVILSYGTNEAFNENLDTAETMNLWKQTVKKIKTTMPNTGIVIIGAPESLINERSKKALPADANECGQRSPSLAAMQSIQKHIADTEEVLFWSWQQAMGGKCSMRKYMAQKLAQKDGVHFTAKGYNETATKFADYLIQLSH